MDKLGNDFQKSAVQVLRASYAALPTQSDMEALISDSRVAETRGYYDPLEDERLREAYSRYLGIRVAIWQMIQTLKPCLLYTSPSPRDKRQSRMPSSA